MFRSKHAAVREFLSRGMTRFECRLHRRLIEQTLREFDDFQRCSVPDQGPQPGPGQLGPPSRQDRGGSRERRRPENATTRRLVDFLHLQVRERLDRLTVLAARHAEFRRNLGRVIDDDEVAQLLLDYAAQLGASWWQLIGDRRALRRWLSDDAMNDRYQRRRGELELELVYLLGRFGVIVAELGGRIRPTREVAELWERLRVESLVCDILEYHGDRRVRVAAMQTLATALAPLRPAIAARLLSHELGARVQRLSTDSSADVWLQCAALEVLARVDPELFASVIQQRLGRPAPGDDLFVRRHCLRQVTEHAARFADNDRLWDDVIQDPSPAVRQQLAAALWRQPAATAWPRLANLIAHDPCPQVRAAALVESLQAVERRELCQQFLSLLAQRLTAETDAFCQRVALHVSVQWLRRWFAEAPEAAATRPVEQLYAERILPAIARIQREATEVPTRRWAAAAAERLWVQLDPAARRLYEQLAPRVGTLPPGRSCRVPAGILRGVEPDVVGRTLAVLTQEDFGVELLHGWGGYRLIRQPRFGFRCWRAWSEFWRPATDKRQAYRHTIGRISPGAVRAPSRIMAELSGTKVPGEPLVMAADGTWRPFLPLVDDFVSTLNQSLFVPRTTTIYSSEGVTEIRASRNPLRRLGASLQLIRRFPALAELRNWDANSSQRPDKYLQAMQRAGFGIKFRPHSGREADSSVSQFFPALLALGSPTLLPILHDLLKGYAYYFSSAFENTLTQLVAFTAVVLGLFLGRHAVSNLRIWWARRRIPLSIGGWGTRGKSGTERLKAALLNGSGHPLVSKTTGCEAMFIQAPAYGDPLEIPLYRPGDKATIWEQSNLLRMAGALRPSAYLWECMALTPDYVDVLQQQWMHDDLATITNTYPDHEDLQGPSGLDVATTITGFVPRRSHLLTTEQQMFPLVRDRCRRQHTTVRGVTWLESGLITDDLLDRFPYREHPDNIALVAAMADELGYGYDFAVKAMADHLIPDLGVLKTHPVAHLQSCALEFTNGMSANERFGCLGNWRRLGFHRHDPHQEPAVFISTVVNNRADRVARSRVFANVLVNDLQADRHFLIGGNLQGLQGFIWEAWGEFERSLSLCREGGPWDAAYARETLNQLAHRFRIPIHDEQVEQALEPMLAAVLPDAAAAAQLARESRTSSEACAQHLRTSGVPADVSERVVRHLQTLLQGRRELTELHAELAQVHGQPQIERLEGRLRQTLKQWFSRKLVVIEDYDASGEEIIQRIVDETPPGFLNRVMGIQNIKGTGLDFVYRFHAWDTCDEACRLLETSDLEARATALRVLESLPEYGLLCQQRLTSALEQLQHAHPPLPATLQVSLETIQRKLAEDQQISQQRRQRQADGSERAANPWLRDVLGKLEQWMEVQDAVRRRKRADQIYRDLQRERISRQRAVEELRKLNKRQKGGWLASRLLSHND